MTGLLGRGRLVGRIEGAIYASVDGWIDCMDGVFLDGDHYTR